MDGVKDMFKSLKNPFKSKFQGSGHRLGGGPDSGDGGESSGSGGRGGGVGGQRPIPGVMRTGPAAQRAEMQSRLQQDEALRKQQEDWRLQQQDKWRQEQAGSRSSTSTSTSARPQAASVAAPAQTGGGFDPFNSMAVSLSRGATPQPPVSPHTAAQGPSQKLRGEDRTTNMTASPLKTASADTEKMNMESQLQQSPLGNRLGGLPERESGDGASQASVSERTQKPATVREAGMILIAGGPSTATVETLLKLMRNILADPSNVKFRRVRLSNPRICETIGIAPGGLGFLEAVGFELTEGAGNDAASTKERWAVMEMDDDSAASRLEALSEAVMLLESYAQRHSQPPPGPVISLRKETTTHEPDTQEECQPAPSETVEPCDRQVRVFLPATDGAPTKIDVPESFYNLAPAELKKEFFTRKKQLEDSQLLIPKSYREKMAAASKRQYKATIIRIQFPDGMVIQGVFAPKERVSAIYEFTRSALQDPSQPFNITYSYPTKKPVIAEQAPPGQLPATLEEAELVPAALVKYRPVSGSEGRVYFEGLRAELINMAVPLTSTPFPETAPVDAP